MTDSPFKEWAEQNQGNYTPYEPPVDYSNPDWGQINASIPNYQEWQAQEMAGERGYWENPYRVARYYNMMQSAPPDWEAPPWLDKKAIETAYKYLELRNDGKPWYEWQPLPEEESGWLRGMEAPPNEFLMPNEQQYARQEPAIVDPYAQYQQKVDWNQLQPWQKLVLGALNTSSKTEGRPEWTRFTASLGQGFLAGLGGAGVGALIGGPPGAVVGGLALGLPTTYQAFTGTEIPVIADILQAFDWAAIQAEKGAGTGVQLFDKYGTILQVLDALPEVYKSDELKAMYASGEFSYETSPYSFNNIIARLFGDTPAGPDEVWQFQKGYAEPVPLLGQGNQGQGTTGGEALEEIRQRVMSGEDIEIIRADIYDRYGDDAIVNDFIAQSVADPLNFAGGLGARVGSGVGKIIGNPALSAAMKAEIGSPLIDALPIGVQQLTQAVTGIKGSGSVVQGLRNYGDWIRQGTAPAGVLPDGTQVPGGQLGFFDRLVAGVTKEGASKDLEPINRTFWNTWRSETPESQASRYWGNLIGGIDVLLAGADNPNLDNVSRAQMVADTFNKYGGVTPVQAGDYGVNIMQSPNTASVQAGVREWLRRGVLDESLTQWINAQPKITQLESISKMLNVTVDKLIKDIADNPDSTLRAIMHAAQGSTDPNAVSILSQFDSPGRLADAFAEFTGLKSNGETTAAQPWKFDDWRARLITSLDNHAIDYSIKRYGVKEGSALYRVSNLLKSVQSLALLDFSPLYLVNNVVNNLVTLAYQGVLGIMSDKSMLDWQTRAGIRPLSPAQTIDMPATMDTLAKLHETVMGDGVLSKMVRDVNRARNKMGVMSKMSRAVETSERNLAYTVGAKRLFKKVHKAGQGFRKMDSRLESLIDSVKPGASRQIYKIIENGLNIAEIEDALFKGTSRIVAADVVDRAAQSMSRGTNLTPDVVADILHGTGLDEQIRTRIETAETPADIQRAIHEVEDVVQEHIDRLAEQEMVHTAEEARTRVQAEGVYAISDILTTLSTREGERWMDSKAIMESAADQADLLGADKSAIWTRAFNDDSKLWGRHNDFETLSWSGVLQAIGINNQYATMFLDFLANRNQAMRDFFDGYYERIDTGERISYADAVRNNIPTRHIDGRADIWRRHYRTIYEDSAAYEAGLQRATAEIADLYERAITKQKSYQMQMDDAFARMWEEHTGRSQQEVREWQQQIADIREQMVQMNRELNAALANTKDKNRRRELHARHNEQYKALINQLEYAKIAGAQDLRGRVTDATPPAPQDIPVVEQVSNILDNQNIQAEAQKITNDYTARMNKRMALDQLAEAYGDKITPEMKAAQAVGLDRMAKQWAKDHNTTTEEFYNQTIAAITKAVDEAQTDVDKYLFQTADPVGSEAFKKWLGNATLIRAKHGTLMNFTEFKQGNKEGYWGDNYYFTNNPEDASLYASKSGPDWENKIERAKELLDDVEDWYGYAEDLSTILGKKIDTIYKWIDNGTIDSKITDKVKNELATRNLGIENEGLVMDVYLRMENPLDMTKDSKDRFTYEYIEEDDSEHGTVIDLIEQIRNTADNYYNADADKIIADLGDDLLEEPLVKDVFVRLRESENVGYIEGDEGDTAGYQFIADLASNLGYDGVIMDAWESFGPRKLMGGRVQIDPMKGIDRDTRHYVVFDNRNIKSVFNKGTYDRTKSNILEQAYDTLSQTNKRGSTSFLRDMRAVMSFTDAANFSTFWHEAAHMLFPQMQGADLEVMARFGGLNDGAEMLDLHNRWVNGELKQGTSEYKRYVDAQEKVARGFEKTLIEGIESVEPEYRTVFQKIRDWMLEIYQDLKNQFADIDIQMVIELDGKQYRVKDVFERLLFEKQTAEDNTASILRMAKENNIPTATKTGKANNRLLLNIINKNADVKYAKIGDVPPDVARQAFELHKQGYTMNEPTPQEIGDAAGVEMTPKEAGLAAGLKTAREIFEHKKDLLKIGEYAYNNHPNYYDGIVYPAGGKVRVGRVVEIVDDGRTGIVKLKFDNGKVEEYTSHFVIPIGSISEQEITNEIANANPTKLKNRQFVWYKNKDGIYENRRIVGMSDNGLFVKLEGKSDLLLRNQIETNPPDDSQPQLFQPIPPSEHIADLLTQGKDAVIQAIKDEPDRQRRNEMLAELDRQAPDVLQEFYQELTQGPKVKTDTPEFKKWFGKSPVVDSNGNPLIVHHGTRAKFEVFDQRKAPYFFSEKKGVASYYGDVGEYYLTGKKMLDLTNTYDKNTRKFIKDFEGEYDEWIDRSTGEETNLLSFLEAGMLYDYEGTGSGRRWQALFRMARNNGYDIVKIYDVTDNEPDNIYVVFDNKQMKSVNNLGTFDPDNPNILYQPAEVPPQPFGDVMPGRTPVNLERGQMLSEVAQEHIRPLLSAIRDESIASLNRRPVSFADLPDNLNADIRNYLNTTVRSDMASEKLASQRYGEQMRDLAMLNYSKRYGFDNVLDIVFPYQFWYTRTMMNWAMRMIEKPAWFSMYARIREAQRKYETKGIPTRLRGKMRMAAPYLPEWAGGSIYFDPLRQLFPFDQFGQPFENMRMMQSQNTQDAVEILRSQRDSGDITAEEYTQAVTDKTGYTWERAYAKAQQDDEDNTPMNLVSMMMSPNLFWTMGKNIINKTPEKIGTMPFTRLGQGLESALSGTPLEIVGKYAGALAAPERAIRKNAGLSEFGEWGDYYVDRMLSDMAADGAIDADTARRAMMERTGPAYDEAVQRVQQEVSLRMPGMLPIYAAKGGGSAAEIGLALLASMFPASLYPEGESNQRALKDVLSEAYNQKNSGQDPDAVNKFYDEYPEYSARLALFDEPEERLRTFLKDEVWSRYMELDRFNQNYAERQFGEMFTDAFLNKETRDYTAIPIQTMAWWAQMLGAALPKVPEVQYVPQGQVETYPPTVTDPLEIYYAERDKLFPNMSAVESLYYDSGKDKGVLKQFPELKDYWDWKRKYKAEHPEVQPALDLVYPESMFGGERNAIENSQQTLTPEQLSQFDDALIRQLFGQYIANQELTYGAKEELMRLWESQGKPGGTFEYYVEEVVRKSLAIP